MAGTRPDNELVTWDCCGNRWELILTRLHSEREDFTPRCDSCGARLLPALLLVEEQKAGFGSVVIQATREEVLNVHKLSPAARRYGVVKGWLDPLTMPPAIAACDDGRLVNRLAYVRVGDDEWHKPELLAPLFAQCADRERRALELALLRANTGENSRTPDSVEDGRAQDAPFADLLVEVERLGF